MDARASIPVSLPVSNPTTSYWQDPPDCEIADHLSSLTVPETADIVIIGSGITGASIAWNLLTINDKPNSQNSHPTSTQNKNIVMLEARQACSGATGRNGGHTKAASYRTFLSNASTHSLSTAKQIARFEYATLKAVHAFARTHAIPCDSWTGDTVDIIYSQAPWDASMKGVSAIREAFKGEDDERTVARYEIWSREEAVRKWCVDGEGVVGAVSYEAGSLSAYQFVIGVLKLCLQKGLQLYTNTPAMKLHQTSDGSWEVETAKGAIGAKQVILATNGYTAFLHAAFQGCIVPLRGQVTAHRPGSNIPQEGLPGTYSFIHSSGYEYMIPRPPGCKSAGDIIIGGGLTQAGEEGLSEYGETDDGRVNERISAYLTASTKMYFGERWGDDDREGRVRREWTGVMGYSSDGYPFVGEVPFAGGGGGGRRGLWVCASFQGHGMVLCWESGRALVDIMRGGGRGREGFLPECFLVSEERMKMRFRGRLNTKVGKVDGRL